MLSLGSGDVLTVSGAASFGLLNNYGGQIDGAGTLATKGTTTLATQTSTYPDLYLGQGATWANTGTVLDGGRIDIGDNAGQTATITNAAGAVFDLTTDTAGLIDYSTSTGSFANAGLLEKTGGTGVSEIDATVTNTGTIAVTSGTLEFDGGGSFGGKITGSGTIAFGYGTATLSTATTTAVLVDGATLDLTAPSLGAVSETSGTLAEFSHTTVASFADTRGDVVLGSGDVLTVSGAASFGLLNNYGGQIDGAGTLATKGTTTLATQTSTYPDLYLGQGATWANTGTVLDGGRIDIGDNAGQTATITNAAGAVFDLTTDTAGLIDYSTSTGSFANAGLLEKTGGTGVSEIDATVTNTGTIAVTSGTLEFDGGGSFGGKITGSGTIAFGYGTATLSTATTTAVLVDGATLDLTAPSLGAVSETSGTLAELSHTTVASFADTRGDVVLGSGDVLTVSGAASFGLLNNYGGQIDGAGTLATKGTTTLATQTSTYPDLYLGQGATWANTGTVLDGGRIDIGDNAGQTATITNAAGAVFDLTTDTAGLIDYSTSTGSFANAGLLEKTGGTGVSEIDATVTNTGTIAVTSGTLEFDGGGSFGGKITGSGTIAFGYGTATLSTATTTAVLVDGATLDLTAPSLGAVSETSGTLAELSHTTVASFADTRGDVVLGSGDVLTVRGAASFGLLNNYGGQIDGAGTLATKGTTTLATQTSTYPDLYLGQGATWANTGTVLDGGRIDIGDNAGQTATITNAAGAVFDLTTDTAGLIDYSTSTGSFANAGLLEKTGGTGVSEIDATVTNTGTIAVTSGTLYVPSLTNLSGTTLTGGNYLLTSGGVLELANNTTIVTDAAKITLSGVGSTVQAYNTTTHAQVGLDATLTTIAAGGALKLLAGRVFAISAGTFTDNGLLQLGGASVFQGGTVAIGAKGTLSGAGTVSSAVTDAGRIDATGGTLSLTGAVSGKGYYTASANAVLDLSQATFTGLSHTTLVQGNFTVDAGGSIALASGASIVTDKARITLNGADSNFQNLDATLATITTTGTLTLEGGRVFNATGNGGTLTLDGLLQLSGATFSSTLLSVANSGIVSGAGSVGGAVADTGVIVRNRRYADPDRRGLRYRHAGGGLRRHLAVEGGGSFAGAMAGAGTICSAEARC